MASLIDKGAKFIGFASKILKHGDKIDKYARSAQALAKAMKQLNQDFAEIWDKKPMANVGEDKK